MYGSPKSQVTEKKKQQQKKKNNVVKPACAFLAIVTAGTNHSFTDCCNMYEKISIINTETTEQRCLLCPPLLIISQTRAFILSEPLQLGRTD